jgi:hypothetical protein
LTDILKALNIKAQSIIFENFNTIEVAPKRSYLFETFENNSLLT